MLAKECAVCQTEDNLNEKKVTRENFLWFRHSAPQNELVWDESACLCFKCENELNRFEEGVITAQGELIFGFCYTCNEPIHENTNHQVAVQGAHGEKFYCEKCFPLDLLSKKPLLKI